MIYKFPFSIKSYLRLRRHRVSVSPYPILLHIVLSTLVILLLLAVLARETKEKIDYQRALWYHEDVLDCIKMSHSLKVCYEKVRLRKEKI